MYKVDLIFPLRRTDVFQAFGEGAEINCGFKGFAKFQSYKNLDVYLEYTYENKEHEIYLKSIKNGFTGRYRYIKDKLNRQNFKSCANTLLQDDLILLRIL